jgi:hypothetical protein
MTETITAKKLSRFGLSADGANCLIEFEKADGQTDRLDFPAAQLDEVVSLLLQVRHIHSERTQSTQRSVLVADRVGVAFQPDTETVVLDFVVGGGPVGFAIPQSLATQMIQVLKEKLPAE